MMETQTEPRRHGSRVTQKVWGAKAELTAHWNEVEMGIQKTSVEPV